MPVHPPLPLTQGALTATESRGGGTASRGEAGGTMRGMATAISSRTREVRSSRSFDPSYRSLCSCDVVKTSLPSEPSRDERKRLPAAMNTG